MMNRKGITPVIATVLLLMLAVGAVGGAFAFVRGMQGDTQEQISEEQETSTSVNSVNCYVDKGGDEGVFEVDIGNTGERTLNLNPVDFVVRMPNEDINYSLSHRGANMRTGSLSENIAIKRTGGSNEWPEPGSFAVYQFNASTRLDATTPYDITITLKNSGHEITETCTPTR